MAKNESNDNVNVTATEVAEAIRTFMRSVALGKEPSAVALASLIGFRPVPENIVNAAMEAVRESGLEIKTAAEKAITQGLIFADRITDIHRVAGEVKNRLNASTVNAIQTRIVDQLRRAPDMSVTEAAKAVETTMDAKTEEQVAMAKFKSALKSVLKNGAEVKSDNDAIAAFLSQAQKLSDLLN